MRQLGILQHITYVGVLGSDDGAQDYDPLFPEYIRYAIDINTA